MTLNEMKEATFYAYGYSDGHVGCVNRIPLLESDSRLTRSPIPVRVVPEAEWVTAIRPILGGGQCVAMPLDEWRRLKALDVKPAEPKPEPTYPTAELIPGTNGRYKVAGHPGLWDVRFHTPPDITAVVVENRERYEVGLVRDTELESRLRGIIQQGE